MSRVTLKVTVDTDPVPGTFHSAEDFEKHIQAMLTQAFPWYNPVVVLERPTTNILGQ